VRAVLFCNLPYSFSILKPLQEELKKRDIEYLWYIPKDLISLFPYKEEPYIYEIKDIERFQSDMIFVPGNDLPWYLRGVKVQVFHGLAGEKKGHFRIRGYFDLYLTQGPYFTERFEKLAKKYKNFRVKETGWCKLDQLFSDKKETEKRKKRFLSQCHAEKIILYAPTFSPSLTSAQDLYKYIVKISQRKEYLVLVKFHDKMDKKIRKEYESMQNQKLIILKDNDITDALKYSDLMISDTSSVVYEFLLLNKPVITYNSRSEKILWENIESPQLLEKQIDYVIYNNDIYKDRRAEIIQNYHPYTDGQSASRMVNAVLEYIDKYGIPDKRKISILRKFKMIKKYGIFRW